MKLTLALIAALAAAPAFAGHDYNDPSPISVGQGQDQGQSQGQSQTGTNTQGQSQSSQNSNAQGQSQDSQNTNANTATGGKASSSSTAGSTATNAGNAQSVAFSSPRQAVEGFSSGTNTTAGCYRDEHAGIGGFIGGVSFGHGRKDHDCARAQLAEQLWARGLTLAGNRVYCTITEVKAALGDDCLALLEQKLAAQRPAPVDYVTQAELDRAIRHGLQK